MGNNLNGGRRRAFDKKYNNLNGGRRRAFDNKYNNLNGGRRRAFDNKYNKLNGGRRRAPDGMPEGMSDAFLCLNEFGPLSAEEACEEMVMLGRTLEISPTNTGLCFNVPINKKQTWLCLTDVQDSEQSCNDMTEIGMRLAVSATDRGNCFLVPLKDEL